VTPFGHLVRPIDPYGLLSLGDQLVTYQPHHHSLFLDQTVSDALGGEGWAVRRQAAFEAAHALLASFYAEFGIIDPEERLELAGELFSAMGHGRLVFEVGAEGGTVRGHDLHYGAGYQEKYGALVKNRRPVDTFAAGFVSAAASLAYPSDWGTLEAEEVACVSRRDELCVFALARRSERPRFGAVVSRPIVEQLPRGGPGSVARRSPPAARAVADLSRMLHTVLPGESGVLRVFGSRLALVPVSYANQITFDTLHLVEKRSPELCPIVGTLVREAAQMGTFHLLGGIVTSPAWRAEHGPSAPEPDMRLEQLVGLTGALGWGTFDVQEFTPGRTLVLASPVTHESAYYSARHGGTPRSRLFFHQGLALGLMYLLDGALAADGEGMKPGAYDAIFRGGARFDTLESRSPLRGDDVCEVTVELAGD
jgi:hypothetical protein